MEELRLEVRDRQVWREWLAQNHDKDVVVWLVLFRRSADENAMTFRQALEEAICFGWIDSRMRTLDSERHLVRFTRRRRGNVWSLRNLRTASDLIKEGRMTPSGEAVLPEDIEKEILLAEEREDAELLMPEDLEKALEESDLKGHFERMSPSNRRAFHRWVVQAKREETRRERVRQVVNMIAKNKIPRSMKDWKFQND
ncbi:MAG: hypothetical protein A4E32_00697 [Methanomassiliicoccales archaeon PtaU1.Bin124]|nr:MAG: hypothetical protein A4E32_00697 [Methanomassiliicoccales archaeon PtaU1.Bin124]